MHVSGQAPVWAAGTVRRLRREVQWRRAGVRRLHRVGAEGFGHVVAQHATPLSRPFAGLDPTLQDGKVVNLRIAADLLDGLLLGPGDRFSFWRHVGNPTARRGFAPGLVLDHGRLASGVGGGMCQLTNLLYWMTLHTPLEVVERWRHSYDVFPDASRTQPFGSGATCAWPSLDLQVANPTASGFRLALGVTATELVGAWQVAAPFHHRYEVYEARHVMSHDAPGVYSRHNELRRRTFGADGEEWVDEPVAVNHALLRYRPFLTAEPEA